MELKSEAELKDEEGSKPSFHSFSMVDQDGGISYFHCLTVLEKIDPTKILLEFDHVRLKEDLHQIQLDL